MSAFLVSTAAYIIALYVIGMGVVLTLVGVAKVLRWVEMRRSPPIRFE
jgi:hypothetical protein